MANNIVPASSTFSNGVLTVVFNVAASGVPVDNFDLTINFDSTKLSVLSSTVPTFWINATNKTVPGQFTASVSEGFDDNGDIAPAIAGGGQLFTVRFTMLTSDPS